MPTIHTFAIPEKYVSNGTARKVGLRQLTVEQEIMASQVGGVNLAKTQYEAVKLSICRLDGEKPKADGTVERFLNEAGPKVRAMLLEAYNHIHGVRREEQEGFLETEEVTIE